MAASCQLLRLLVVVVLRVYEVQGDYSATVLLETMHSSGRECLRARWRGDTARTSLSVERDLAPEDGKGRGRLYRGYTPLSAADGAG